jgi:hypothetical protein
METTNGIATKSTLFTPLPIQSSSTDIFQMTGPLRQSITRVGINGKTSLPYDFDDPPKSWRVSLLLPQVKGD